MIRPGIRRLFRLALRRRDLTGGDVNDEIRTHLDLRAEQLMHAGLDPIAARAEALRKFGALDHALKTLHHTAATREQKMELREWWDAFQQDVRYAARGLRREPLFTVFVTVTLALGIGANAAMFGVVDRLLLSGPAYVRDPGQLMRLYRTINFNGNERTSSTTGWVSYDLLRTNAHSFDGVAAYRIGVNAITMGRESSQRLVNLGESTAGFFPLLGVQPLMGHFYTERDDDPVAPEHVAVLGYGVWQSEYGGDQNVIGKSIVLGGTPYTIIGVAKKGFTGPELRRVDIWIPLSVRSQTVTKNWTTSWNAQWLKVLVRVKAGVSAQQASADVDAVRRAGYTGNEPEEKLAKMSVRSISFTGTGGEATEVKVSRWLVGVALMVLLIACSNIANLLLARAVRRRREVAVRLALGAGRARLIRLLLTESVMLAGIAAMASLAVAWVTGTLMRRVLLPDVEWVSSPVDGRVLAVTLAVAVIVGVLVGLLPALQASRPNLTSALKSGIRDGGSQSARLRATLTVAQAALSVVLLIGAGLFVRSLNKIHALDLGLQPDRVVVVSVRWPTLNAISDTVERAAERARRVGFYPRAVERFQGLPDVEAASLVVGLPFQSSFGLDLKVPGWDSLPKLKGGGPNISAVTSDYFATVGNRVIRGRGFTAQDRAGTEPISLVNQTMAETLWPGKDALGECLIIGDAKDKPGCTRVVGVIADSHQWTLKEDPSMHYYIPFGQEKGMGGTELLVRPRGDPTAAIATLRRVLREMEPSLPYVNIKLMQDDLDPQIRPWRLGASMFGLMGVLALIVAAVGLYSVMSYLVAQRTHEMGVRIALGASRSNILGLILRSSVGLATLGVIIGTAMALYAGRFVKDLLFDISPRDPLVFGGVVTTLLVVAVLASLLPALRAQRVDPMEALRAE